MTAGSRSQLVWVVTRTGADRRSYSDLFATETEAREVAAKARRAGRFAHVARLRLPAGIVRVGGGER